MPAVKKISNARVKKIYKKLGSLKETAEFLDCSITLVSQAVHGVRKCPIEKRRRKDKRKKCINCGDKAVGRGKHFFCDHCHYLLSREYGQCNDYNTCNVKL